MIAHRIETLAYSRESRSISDSSDGNVKKIKSVIDLVDDCEMPRNVEIGTTDPETSFERYFWVNVKLLTVLGLFSTNFRLSGRLVNSNTWTVLPVLIAVSQMLFFAICECRAFVRFWSTDPDFAISAFTSFVSGALAGFKGFRLWMCQVELRELLIQLAILWERSRFQVNVRERILKIAEHMRRVASWYLGMVLFTAICYSMRPYLLLLQFKLSHEENETYDYSMTVMTAVYPFTTDTLEKYLACVNWEMLNAICLALYWSASDALFAQLVSHITMQFQVLYYDLKSIGAESKDTGDKNEALLLRKLCSIAKRHGQLVAHCKTIEAIYNPTIFLTMISTAVTMCFCTLNVQKAIKNGNSEEVAKNVGQLVTVIVQLLIFCGYADNLTDQNFQIAHAAYHCDWIDRSARFKINLQIIMMRAQKYYCLSGYGFFQLNFTQITAIINSTLSYFALLKTLT